MKKLKIYCLLLFLTTIFANCGHTERRITNSQNSINSLKDTDIHQVKVVLPPLEKGEFHVTDSAFGATVNLIGQPLNVNIHFEPNQLIIKDKYLIINTWKKDSIFLIFELPELKCISALGLRYLGPEGFVNPKMVDSSEDSILFYIYENTDDKVYKVTLNHLLPEFFISLPKQKGTLSDKQIAFYNHNIAYYSASTTDDRKIYYFNKDSVPQEKVIKDLAIQGIKGSWTTVMGDFGINKELGRIAYAYKYYKRIKIIDIKSLDERNIIFKARKLENGLNDVETNEPTNITHFWGMSAKAKYFWLLYSGRTPIDVQRDNQLKKKYMYVEKYDWNGKPIKRYRLNDWGYFCVDQKYNTIYVASTANIGTIVKFVVPD